jgi:hypothetical protein
MVKLPRTDGGVALAGTLQPKTFKLRGGFAENQGGITDVRAALDNLTLALSEGPANLSFDTDRYWRNVQKTTLSTSYDPTWYPRIATVEIDLVTPDPFQYSTTGGSDTWNTPSGSHNISNSFATAYSWSVFTFHLSAAAAINVTLENTTTGESCTIDGSTATSTMVLDCDAQTFTDGAGNSFIGLFDGVFPRMTAGMNQFTLTLNGAQAATINSLVTTWTPRFF